MISKLKNRINIIEKVEEKFVGEIVSIEELEKFMLELEADGSSLTEGLKLPNEKGMFDYYIKKGGREEFIYTICFNVVNLEEKTIKLESIIPF